MHRKHLGLRKSCIFLGAIRNCTRRKFQPARMALHKNRRSHICRRICHTAFLLRFLAAFDTQSNRGGASPLYSIDNYKILQIETVKMNKLTFINNQVYDQLGPLTQKISFFKHNQQFIHQLMQIWQLFVRDENGFISKKEFQNYFFLIYKFLIYVVPDEFLEQLASQMINQKCYQNDSISLDSFIEIFAQFVVIFIENVSLESAIDFIKNVFNRTTQMYAKNLQFNEETLLGSYIQVQFLPNLDEEVNTNIYFVEVLVYEQEQYQNFKFNSKQIIEYKILDKEQIIPLGISAENVLHYYFNHEQNADNLEIEHLQFNQPLQCLNKLIHTSFLNKHSLEQFNQNKNQQSNLVGIVLSKGQSFRINSYLKRQVKFEFAQNKKGQKLQFNTLSDFYSKEDFQIDRIWEIQNQKEQKRSGVKSYNKKEFVDNEYYTRNLQFNLIKNVNEKHIDEVEIEYKPYDPSILNKYISQSKTIQVDNKNSFQDDIIEYANKRPLQLLAVSYPKSGLSSFCWQLSLKIDVVHIELQKLIQKTLDKMKDTEPELDDDGNPKEMFKDFEKNVKICLEDGEPIPFDTLLQLVNQELQSDNVLNKGFILDLPLQCDYNGQNWIQAIIRDQVKLPKDQVRYFSHVLTFEQSIEDLHLFSETLMEDVKEETIKLYSKYDREEIRNKKPSEDDEEQEIVIIEEKNCFFRRNENSDQLDEAAYKLQQIKNNQLKQFTSFMTKQQHIQIQIAGLNNNQRLQIAIQNLNQELTPIRPIAIKLDADSEKGLLTQGLDETKLVRRWSPWQQIDPVFLNQGKVVAGKPEFACDYGSRVFLFENEENQTLFFNNCRKFLKKSPQLPKTYNVAIFGAKKSGKTTVASQLQEKYG